MEPQAFTGQVDTPFIASRISQSFLINAIFIRKLELVRPAEHNILKPKSCGHAALGLFEIALLSERSDPVLNVVC